MNKRSLNISIVLFYILIIFLLLFRTRLAPKDIVSGGSQNEPKGFEVDAKDSSSEELQKIIQQNQVIKYGGFFRNIGQIINNPKATSTKIESTVLFFTPNSDKLYIRARSDGVWLPELDTYVDLFYPYNGEKPIKIWLASDMQIGFDDTTRADFETAIRDIDNEVDVDYVFILGDLVHHVNRNSPEYDEYIAARAISTVPLSNWYELVGTHDINSATYPLDFTTNFREKLGYDDVRYTLELGNITFIFFSEDYSTVPQKLAKDAPPRFIDAIYREWFETSLRDNQDKNIIILSHHSMRDTTYNTQKNYFGPSIELIKILEKHAFVAWFHGHLHKDLLEFSPAATL